MARNKTITVSAPSKVHLLGEWAVVWGKPALLTSVDLRITITISASKSPTIDQYRDLRKIIEPIVKKELKIKAIPKYSLTISSEAPIGAGLGSSAAISTSFIAALLTFLKVKWDKDLINKLTFEAEKVFHGNPSGADNSTVVYGGLVWYRKELSDLKIIHPLPFSVPTKLSKNFLLINTGTPGQTTKQMVTKISSMLDKKPRLKNQFLENQEKLVRELLPAIKNADEKEITRIIKQGEKNLESIGVCSLEVKKIIRQIEKLGGVAKICGAGAMIGPTGVMLCYHPDKKVLIDLAKSLELPYFSTKLGVDGVKIEGNL